jgi:hypothetical protein
VHDALEGDGVEWVSRMKRIGTLSLKLPEPAFTIGGDHG